ncbi:hypothetical protein ACFL3G_11355 [Planctomycetota bacterium]
MNKKIIIITVAAGLVGFAGFFAFSFLTHEAPQLESQSPEQTAQVDSQQLDPLDPEISPESVLKATAGKNRKGLTEKQLRELVYDVREKITEYDQKLKSLQVREQRLQATQNTLKEDIAQLNNLRDELTSTVMQLKEEQGKLAKSMVEIENAERENLVSIAAAYDKMAPESASKILTNMTQAQDDNSSANDAIKILYYMSEKKKAKVLSVIAEKEPAISAYFCRKLKTIIERN